MTLYEAFIDELNKLAVGAVPGKSISPMGMKWGRQAGAKSMKDMSISEHRVGTRPQDVLHSYQKTAPKPQPLRPSSRSKAQFQSLMNRPKTKIKGLTGAFA